MDDHGFQLTNIARVGIFHKGEQNILGQTRGRAAEILGGFVHECVNEKRNVFVAFAQGRYVDMVGAEAEDILTKTPFMLLRLDIPVGGTTMCEATSLQWSAPMG